MAEKIRFQTIDVKFPEKLYALGIWVLGEDSKNIIFMIKMSPDLKSAVQSAAESVSLIKKQFVGEHHQIPNSVLIIETELNKKLPLKKELWTLKPRLKLLDRYLLFIKALEKPHFYSIMVTPFIETTKEGKPVTYCAAFPFMKSDINEVNILMRESDMNVSPEAKNCAVYDITKIIGYDLEKRREVKNNRNRNSKGELAN